GRNDFSAALKKLGAVALDAVERVGERDVFRIARVPGILGQARLVGGGFRGERGKGRAAHNGTLPEYETRGGLQQLPEPTRIQKLVMRHSLFGGLFAQGPRELKDGREGRRRRRWAVARCLRRAVAHP